MFNNLLRDLCELVYPSTPFTDPDLLPIDFSQESLTIDRLTIEYNRPPFCVKCSRHLEGNLSFNHCSTCRRLPPDFDFALSACLYTESLKNLIYQFKYQQKTLYRHLFGRLLISFIDTYHFDIKQFDCLMPIPLFVTRKRERGYNQAELLAHAITKHYHIPLRRNNLARTKPTRPQSELDQKERWTNLHDAFTIKHSIDFYQKNILIIDDVLTTGATASQAARVLKKAGANRVGVLTLATTP